MKNNAWMMLVCCLAPLLIFVVAPAIGLNGQNLSWIFVPAMLFVCFLMMGKGGGCCGGHGGEKAGKKDEDTKNKEGKCH